MVGVCVSMRRLSAQSPVLLKTKKSGKGASGKTLWGAASHVHLHAASSRAPRFACLWRGTRLASVSVSTSVGQEVAVICHVAAEDSAGTVIPTLLFL